MTSKIEGFPLVLLEAISKNIPCLSFRIPYGPLNIIKDGLNGYFIEDDIIDFNQKIDALKKMDRTFIYTSIKEYDFSEILKKAKDNDLIDRNIFEKVQAPKNKNTLEVNPFTEKELNKIMKPILEATKPSEPLTYSLADAFQAAKGR